MRADRFNSIFIPNSVATGISIFVLVAAAVQPPRLILQEELPLLRRHRDTGTAGLGGLPWLVRGGGTTTREIVIGGYRNLALPTLPSLWPGNIQEVALYNIDIAAYAALLSAAMAAL